MVLMAEGASLAAVAVVRIAQSLEERTGREVKDPGVVRKDRGAASGDWPPILHELDHGRTVTATHERSVLAAHKVTAMKGCEYEKGGFPFVVPEFLECFDPLLLGHHLRISAVSSRSSLTVEPEDREVPAK